MNEFRVPLQIRHFHANSGRLVATVVATTLSNGAIAVGIARCNKKDRPSKKKGRDLASARLIRGLFSIGSYSDYVANLEATCNLFKIMTETQFKKLLESNPFAKWGCPFGVRNEDLTDFQKISKPTSRKKVTKKTSKKTTKKVI